MRKCKLCDYEYDTWHPVQVIQHNASCHKDGYTKFWSLAIELSEESEE